ncbi:hypothetical protein Taro_051205 [Colocasia esculenta]|uniref:Uncharacterized protein n=1 Tax=Colocasia esculenta TaxID=4460 RepID=A0A843XGF1_COLES|nr:hypothetical protein [Colocasia esculenta]
MPFGARRRHPFLREGPNRFVLRVEVGTLDPLALSMLPSPLYIVFPLWFGAWECENSMLEVDGLADRDRIVVLLGVVTARAVATGWRQGMALRPCRNGPMRRDLSQLSWLDWDAEVRLLSSGRERAERRRQGGETSQKRQGACRAEETGQ